MENPVCLIENSESGELLINQKAVDDILSKIKQPVVVVAIAGLYRTGKSYLMNKLADRRKGFSLGSTIQSQTKGIWMMCLPHPLQRDHCLILLDTEGLGDVEKGNTNNDAWIFALSVLLSSMLVYNSMGTIDQYALDKLHYVTELTDLIKVKSGGGEDESPEFTRFFPAFVWSVRDFSLELKLDGKKVTEDGYLESALKLKHGTSKSIQQYNLPRECIRNYFPSRKCFVFDRPADKETMWSLEQVADSQLDPEFVKQTQTFVQYVYSTARTKTLKGGHPVTGRMLGALAVTYVDAIRSGQIPCLESAVHTLADIENTAAVQEAAQAYQEWMEKRVSLPTETVEELSKVHNQVLPEALKLFMRRCFNDKGQRYQEQFTKEVAKMYAAICEKNREMSVDISSRAISDLAAAVQKNIKQGYYTNAGGYSKYQKDMAKLVKQYRAKPRKGVQAEQVLEDFLRNMQQFSDSLRQVDQTMTEWEKEIAGTVTLWPRAFAATGRSTAHPGVKGHHGVASQVGSVVMRAFRTLGIIAQTIELARRVGTMQGVGQYKFAEGLDKICQDVTGTGEFELEGDDRYAGTFLPLENGRVRRDLIEVYKITQARDKGSNNGLPVADVGGAAQEKAEMAEQEQKVAEEERRATEQRLFDERRAMEENLAQLKEKAKQEQAQLLEEHEKVLNQRLQEQEKLIKDGFQGRADELQQEIDSLKKEKDKAASPSFVDMAIDTAILTAPGFYKAIPITAKVGKFLWNKFF
ncbi:guanylate-binding protein 1-like [Stegostoma tigrinum]|uniref:guanylate-binding protein 1-like n=1 Tax=Stegostoma tigrinum TaxID=3053191 RepID=UPI00287075E8|nr:guanylate-binding protein 1-like [Stegostoma tigrinum]